MLTAAAAGASGTDMRDPLRPPGYIESTGTTAAPAFDAGAWKLAYTLVSQGRRVAIINGDNVSAGDVVAGARVIAIEPGRAVLDYNGRRFTIRRTNPSVRYREQRGERAQ